MSSPDELAPTPAPSERTVHVDPRTATGVWHIVRGRYGRRHDDRPLWWVVGYHLVVKPVGFAITVLLWLLFAWLAHRCGIDLPGGTLR